MAPRRWIYPGKMMNNDDWLAVNAEEAIYRVLFNIEIWGVGLYLVDVGRV